NRTVACWGANEHGQLGDGTELSHWLPRVPRVVKGLTDAVEIAAGYQHSCARLSDDTVRCWGNNDAGQLGDGTMGGFRSAPVTVLDLTGARELALSKSHSCARLSDGTAKCWGSNDSGQLGDGSTTSSSKPVSVTGIAGVEEIATKFGHASTESTSMFTCARLS